MHKSNLLLIENIRALVEIIEEEMAKLGQKDCKLDEILEAVASPHDSALAFLQLAEQVMLKISDREERKEFVLALYDLTKRFNQVSGQWHQIVDTGLRRDWKSFYL